MNILLRISHRLVAFLLPLIVLTEAANAQTVSVFAGNGTLSYGDGGFAIDAVLDLMEGILVDKNGNVYISTGHRIRRISPDGVINTIAGYMGQSGKTGDGGPAVSARLNFPKGMAMDNAGNLYIADSRNNCIRKIDNEGIITTVAGFSGGGFTTDTLAIHALLKAPQAIAFDERNNMYIADAGNNRICKVDSNGFLTTIAGHLPGTVLPPEARKDSFPAIETRMYISGIGVLPNGDVVYSDHIFHVIRRITPEGLIFTIAGKFAAGTPGEGDSGPAISAALSGPLGLQTDAAGNIYFVDQADGRIRKITTNDYVINTVARVPGGKFPTVSRQGNIYVASDYKKIYYVSVNEVEGKGDMMIYPNPCEGKAYVSLPLQYQEMATIYVMDISGRVISVSKGQTNGSIGIDLPRAGVFAIRATSAHGDWGGKVSVVSH